LGECTKWDEIPEETDIRDMIPWVNSEANFLIGVEEEEFNRKLEAVGNENYLGNSSTFQLHHVLAFQGAALSLLTLLDKGVDLLSKTEFGVNILHLAAAGGHEDMVGLALNRGIEINLAVEGGMRLTPLMLAARMGHENIVALLVKEGANIAVTDTGGNSALSHAAARAHDAAVGILLDNGAQVELKNSEGWSALHHASSKGHANVVQKLINHGADVNAMDSDGLSSLFRATTSGHADVVRLLLRSGANPNLKSSDDWSPLGAAILMGHEGVVLAFVEAPQGSIDLEARMGASGRTALKIAVDKKFESLTRLSESW
jgi:uncharacterized protein